MYRKTLLVTICAAGSLLAADPPYAGKWKLNAAKSDFGETTLTYEKTSGGEMKATADGQSYTFKADGKDYPTPWGVTVSWKNIDANTWETSEKVNGKLVSTSTLKVSPDNKTLAVDSKRAKATGEASNDSIVLNRVSGDSGLVGKWKTKNFKMSSPTTVDIAAKGAEGLTLTYVDEKGICDAMFDAKDHPARGPMWPPGWTCSISKNGARGFDLAWKKDGKPMYKTTLTVSSDGKTLTESGSAAAVNERVKMVYDRQ
jgi:hypothetical protein